MTEAADVRKTFFNRVALPLFSWGLPFHSFIIAMLLVTVAQMEALPKRMAQPIHTPTTLCSMTFAPRPPAAEVGSSLLKSLADNANGASLATRLRTLQAAE